ncbi:MAG: hypothetical protein ACM3YO_02490 [Bacteroidota bacterium]
MEHPMGDEKAEQPLELFNMIAEPTKMPDGRSLIYYRFERIEEP